MAVDSSGHVTSSGQGMDGFLRAWRGFAAIFEVELPRLVAAIFRLRSY
jgi:hypothetical protein